MDDLFQLGDFTFSSGRKSKFKLDCDQITDSGIEALAYIGVRQIEPFGRIVAVPKGKSGSPIDNAKRLADAMEQYITPASEVLLIVDDVWTTGASMETCRKIWRHELTIGWVAFAYTKPAEWTTAGLIVSPMNPMGRPSGARRLVPF